MSFRDGFLVKCPVFKYVYTCSANMVQNCLKMAVDFLCLSLMVLLLLFGISEVLKINS